MWKKGYDQFSDLVLLTDNSFADIFGDHWLRNDLITFLTMNRFKR